MTPPTGSAAFVRSLVEFAASKGAPRDVLLARAGLRESDFSDVDARIPYERYQELMRAAKSLTGDDALALHFGEHVQMADVSIVGLIGRASESLMDAATQLARFSRVIQERSSIRSDQNATCRSTTVST